MVTLALHHNAAATRALLLFTGAMFAGCGGDGPTGTDDPDATFECSLDPTYLISGGAVRDGIPALSDPPLVDLNDPGASAYLDSDDRVVGFVLDGVPIAVPHNILWHHEIVNLTGASTAVAVTYCPLTGSAIVFNRSVLGGGEFRVSGLLFQSNLMMFDRETDSLWPQMLGQARCGPRDGAVIPTVASWEMTWSSWQAANPFTKVVSSDTGHPNDYSAVSYPYGAYEDLNSDFFFDMPPADGRRPPKERVLGIPGVGAEPALVFPFRELDDVGALVAVPVVVQGQDLVVLWDRQAQGATVFESTVNGEQVEIQVLPVGGQGEVGFFDEGGTRYGLDGEAKSGPRRGQRLTAVPQAYVAFWRAWAAFHEGTQIWEN